MSIDLSLISNDNQDSIYVQFQNNERRTESDVRNEMNAKLEEWWMKRPESLVLENTERLDEVLNCIMPRDGRQRNLFISNASTQENVQCNEHYCTLEDPASCKSHSLNCRNLILRPKCDLQSLDEMFPGPEVLGVKGFLRFCPMNVNGCVFTITNLLWLPKCACRPFEREVEAQFIFEHTSPYANRPRNLLTESFLAQLPPVSIQTRKELQKWNEYLGWRERLISANKHGIRCIDFNIDSKNETIQFLTISENAASFKQNLRWLRSEDVRFYSLAHSRDAWNFHAVEGNGRTMLRSSREWGVPLGNLVSTKEETDSSRALEECPWRQPNLMRVTFRLANSSKISSSKNGFLCPSSFGDDVLIGRLRRTVETFQREGSSASPFLSSWIFDIGNARLPQKLEDLPDPEWRNQNLNEAQKKAVKVMLAAPDVALIQGPPGTGKTTVIAEATAQFVRQGKRVLITSQSIAAVENALERLENVPELRALCLKKKFGDPKEKTCRYAEENVLQNYYQTLGLGARQDLERWTQLELQLRESRTFHEQLTVIEDRIRLENEQIQKLNSNLQQLQQQLQITQKRQRENQSAQLKKAAWTAFLKWIQEQLPTTSETFQPTEKSTEVVNQTLDTENLPKEVLTAFAQRVVPVLEELRTYGVAFQTEALDSDWPAAMQLTAIRQALGKFRKFAGTHLPYFKKELDRLSHQSGETVLSSTNRLKLEDLKAQIQELDLQKEEADENEDDKLYAQLDECQRLLNRKKKALLTSSGLDETHFRTVFSGKDVRGLNLADEVLAPHHTRSDVVAFLEKYLPIFTNWQERLEQTLSHFQRTLSDALEEMSVEEDTFSRQIRHLESEIMRLQDLQSGSRQKLAQAEQNGKAGLAELRKRFALSENSLQTVTEGLAWTARAHAELQRHEQESRPEREAVAPLLKAWTERLQKVTSSDNIFVLPIYRQNCEVFGITCTADDRPLRELVSDFDVVIIDEVSKATPPELLRSMMMAPKTILVGDHRQLPPLFSEREPLTFEEIARQEEEDDSIPDELKIVTKNFSQYRNFVEASYFKINFEKADSRMKSMLEVQFRMHSQIMNLINEFYGGRLSNGLQNEEETRRHFLTGPKIPYLTENGHAYWVDSTETPTGKLALEKMAGRGSYQNGLEVQLILKTLRDMDAALEGKMLNGRPIRKTVGVIAFYGKQTGLLKQLLTGQNFRNLDCKVETVDRFQGQERDFILVSMTRNSQKLMNRNSRSFVTRFERMNVAFSRARELLMIFGARRMFENCEVELPAFLPDTSDLQKPEKQLIYRRIIHALQTEGRVLRASRILSREEWIQISEKSDL